MTYWTSRSASLIAASGPTVAGRWGSIYANEFEAPVPLQYWQVERIDGFANSATDPLKLQRCKVAHFWMSRELYSSPQGQA